MRILIIQHIRPLFLHCNHCIPSRLSPNHLLLVNFSLLKKLVHVHIRLFLVALPDRGLGPHLWAAGYKVESDVYITAEELLATCQWIGRACSIHPQQKGSFWLTRQLFLDVFGSFSNSLWSALKSCKHILKFWVYGLPSKCYCYVLFGARPQSLLALVRHRQWCGRTAIRMPREMRFSHLTSRHHPMKEDKEVATSAALIQATFFSGPRYYLDVGCSSEISLTPVEYPGILKDSSMACSGRNPFIQWIPMDPLSGACPSCPHKSSTWQTICAQKWAPSIGGFPTMALGQKNSNRGNLVSGPYPILAFHSGSCWPAKVHLPQRLQVSLPGTVSHVRPSPSEFSLRTTVFRDSKSAWLISPDCCVPQDEAGLFQVLLPHFKRRPAHIWYRDYKPNRLGPGY